MELSEAASRNTSQHPEPAPFAAQPQAHLPMPEKFQQSHQPLTQPIDLVHLRESAAPVVCPLCSYTGMTKTEYHSGGVTNAWGIGAFLFCCVCCWVPYVMDSTKDVDHFCGQCKRHLATWHRSGRTEVERGAQRRVLRE